MAKLVVLITTHVEKTLEIAEAWQKAGAPGVTLVPSHGFRTLKARSRKLELPHFVNLATILKQVDDTTQMLLSVVDDNLLVLLNASHQGVKFTLPPAAAQLPRLELLLNTAAARHEPRYLDPKDPFELAARSLALFRWPFSH